MGRAATLAVSLAVAALVACGGSDQDQPADRGPEAAAPEAAAPPADGAGTLVAALGDSITAGNPGYDPDPAAQSAGLDNPRSQYEFWAEREQTKLEFRNCGIAGELTYEIASRLEDCAEGAEVLIVQGGVNDIAGVVGAPPEVADQVVVEAAENLGAMVRSGKEMGLRVALANVGPWNNGFPLGADPLIRELNRLIAEVGRVEGVPVLPWYRTLNDPANPGRMKPAWTAEGDHPSVLGYKRLGEIAFRLP